MKKSVLLLISFAIALLVNVASYGSPPGKDKEQKALVSKTTDAFAITISPLHVFDIAYVDVCYCDISCPEMDYVPFLETKHQEKFVREKIYLLNCSIRQY